MGEKVLDWAGDHPYAAASLGVIGLFIILWLLGFFSSSKASEGSGGGGNLAAAYYAAEAAQAQAGAQIQSMTLQTAAATAIASRQAQMTEAVAQTQAGAAVLINGQNTGAATTINAQDNFTARALSSDQLQATANTNYWTTTQNFHNNATAASLAQDANRTSVFNSFLNNVIPAEIAAGSLTGVYQLPAGLGTYSAGQPLNPAQMRAAGYSENQIAWLVGQG